MLLQALIASVAALGYWNLVSRVFPDNAASRALCRSCGFREVGVYLRHGRLAGRWSVGVRPCPGARWSVRTSKGWDDGGVKRSVCW